MLNLSNKLLSDIVAYRTYNKLLIHQHRKETLEETINRNMNMHLDKFPKLSRDIIKSYQYVHDLKVMPSMRSMQFGGKAIIKNNVRLFNCSYLPMDDMHSFSEILFLLLSGAGVGFSVQKSHINNLPKIGVPREEGLFIVHDSIQGWAQAVQVLVEAYFNNGIRPLFDFNNIRAKGEILVTSCAKAPGPEPLKRMLFQVEEIIKKASERKLTSLEIYDIVCLISDCVLSGGIRRAALICLFDSFDEEMLKAKSGDWLSKYPWRSLANNSAVLFYENTSKEQFDYIFGLTRESQFGEPAFVWSNNPEEYGTNPCGEIGLRNHCFCNLTTINQSKIKTKADFLKRVHAAILLGTLQASYTDFPFLRSIWKKTTEEDALLGASFTGIADSVEKVSEDWLIEGAKLAAELNEKYAKKIGINIAKRLTTVKPEGSSSCVLGCSSGIHARHAKYYLRRVQMNRMDPLAHYLLNKIPDLVEEVINKPSDYIITIPQETPSGAILRSDESAIDLFNRVLKYNKVWIRNGHREGDNFHNVSCTINVKEEEFDKIRELMWKNKKNYHGIALLNYDGGKYEQAPFEECSKDTFEKYSKIVKEINLKEIKEDFCDDFTLQAACSSGSCEITKL